MTFTAIAPISRQPTPALSGHVLTEGFWSNASGYTPSASGIKTYQTVANPVSTDLVTSTVELDYVGRGDRGGDLVIGSLSTGATDTSLGVQQFDITVKRDSNLEVISSTNNSLQVVNLVNSGTHKYLGAYERASGTTREGDLSVRGSSNVTTLLDGLKFGPFEGATDVPEITDQDIDGATQAQNNGYGFTDVKTMNGAGFKGQLDISAILTANVVGKYLNLTDKAPALANVDNVEFNYTLGSNDDVLDLAISSANLSASGTTNREDFILNIKAGTGKDVISTAIYDGTPAWTTSSTTDGLDLADANSGNANWYQNSISQRNLNIDGGSGDDVINTFGSGAWNIVLGSGSDTYYSDNSGEISHGVGSVNATWVFNTASQATPTGVVSARNLDNLQTGDNARYVAGVGTDYVTGAQASLFGLKLRVAFQDVSAAGSALPDTTSGQGVFISKVVDVPTAATNKYIVTDLNINQAIKKAINDDPVLSKLLVATDGPANTLVVTALSDGRHINVDDLQIEFAIPDAVSAADVTAYNAALGNNLPWVTQWTDVQLAAARQAAFVALTGGATVSSFDGYGLNAAADGYGQWARVTGDNSYASAFANAGSATIQGAFSYHTTSNIIDVSGSAADHDVVVLSTGALGTDTLVWHGFNNGTTTVVNFQSGTAGTALPPASETITIVFTTPAQTVLQGETFDFAIGGTSFTGTTGPITGSDGTLTSNGGELANLLATALGAGWAGTFNGSNTITLTGPLGVNTAGTAVLGGTSIAVSSGGTSSLTAITSVTGVDGTPGISSLGQDTLDFTAYGASWLGAALLDDTANHYITGSWTRADYTFDSTSASASLPGHVAGAAGSVARNLTDIRTGEKYITLTHILNDVDGAVGNASDPHRETLYKVELWTVVGNEADAYRDLVAGETRDTAQLIGYVDVGRVIEGYTDVEGILANIDY